MKTSRSLSWSELKVGVIVIIALVLLAVGVLQLGGKAGFFTRNYKLYIYLDNTFGLKVGNTVRLAGIDVGNVEDISFPANPSDKRIIITLKIQEKFKDRIREDSMGSIRTLGLLGDKYVDIQVGSPSSPVLEPGGTLKGAPETQLSRVLTGATTGIEGLNVVLGQLRVVLGSVAEGQGTAGLLLKDPRLYHELTDAAAGIDEVAADLKKGKGSLGKLIEEPDLYNNLVVVSAKAREVVDKLNKGSLVRLSEDKQFYENLRDISDNLKDVSTSSKALVANLEKGNLARLSNDKELYSKVQNISTRLDGVIERLEKGKGSAGKLLTDEELYNNMDRFFRDADTLVLDIKENPRKYLHISIF